MPRGRRRPRGPRPRPAPGEPPRDPEAAARRAAEREARVAGGVEDLRRWLRDAVRGGLGAGRLRTWDEWDGFAARLVDAQAPGAASRLRSLGSIAAGRPDGWPERLLSGLGLLHLLCEAHARADGPVRDDVRALLGWNVGREEVLAGPRVPDRWPVLARTVIEQERLRVQRTWLWGLEPGGRRCCWTSRRWARPWNRARPGMALAAELAFYPGARRCARWSRFGSSSRGPGALRRRRRGRSAALGGRRACPEPLGSRSGPSCSPLRPRRPRRRSLDRRHR